MAGVVKGVQQVVSSCPAETSVCVTPKSNQCGAFNTDSQPVVDNFSFVDVNNKDLLAFNPPTSDDTSLQDLIDSELALRISSNTLEHDDVPQLDSSSPRSPSPDLDSAGFAAPKPVVNGNIITDFLDQERSHTESASSVSSPAAPLCSGDDFDDLLGSEPADSDFSPNIPDADAVVDAKNDNADEATLAEDISFASDKSQERAERGSLLDLDPLQPDSPEEQCEPQPEGLERRRMETEEVGEKEQPAEQPERQSPETRPLFQGGEESAQAEPVPDALDVLASAADAEPEPETEPECGHSETEARQDPDDEYAGRLDLEAPDPNYPSGVNDSMDVFASAVPGPPAPNPVTPAGGAVFEDGFETWSTVEEAVVESGLLDAVVPHSADPDPDPEPEPVTEPVESDTETVSETTEKKVSKKKKMEGTDSTSTKKKTKKNKKSDAEKENISVRRSFGDLRNCENAENGVLFSPEEEITNEAKSSFSKFDQLSKKTVLHVRSVDASKVQKQFNESASTTPESQSNCKSCGKQVFVMEQIKAEKAVWHKNCFRCKECSKQLTVDTYSSNEGELYCKPHFRELFKPKAVVDETPEPTSDKPDLGLEELSSLNVKSRFQVFEKTDEKNLDVERSSSTVNVKRSPSILSKLAKFQAKGMDIGVTDDSLNGIPYEESSTSSEEESEEGEGDEENGDIVKSSRKTRERPMSFSKMEDVKSRWETGSAARKEERREERKQEIQSIRSRLFMGKQGKMKEMYEQAVKESEQPAARKGAEVRSEKAKSIKEKFERGETLVSDEEGDEHDTKKIREDDIGVFEAGISKKSRSLFMELDATAAKTGPVSPAKPTTPREEKKREMESPEREIYRDPEVVRAEDRAEEDELQHSMTTSKMLSLFRQMEEKAQREDVPDGPKPLKCFTPPPDCTQESGTSEEESSEEEESEEEDEMDHANDGIIRSSDKPEDEFLKAAKEAAKAKTLRAKFEHWEEQENNINNGGGNINPTLLESEHESIESTKSLRARFESLRHEAEAPKEKPRPKVNRFVEIQTSCAEFCDSCQKKVYPLEKVETGGKLFHKGCFRCVQCSCVLRMESYTLNNGKLYCIPHYKQLFISKGNYDEGFGLDQHKRKWKSSMRDNGDILLSGIDANGNSH